MKEIKTIKDIDISLPEGRLLLVAIGKLSSIGKYRKWTPDKILEYLTVVYDSSRRPVKKQ